MNWILDKKTNRRGQTAFEDIFYVMAFLFFAGLLFFFAYYTYNTHIKEELSSALTGSIGSTTDAYGNDNMNVSRVLSQTSGGVSIFNSLYPLLLIGLIIVTVISAYNMGSHPVFFFVMILVLMVVLILSVVLSNTYHQITSASEFSSTLGTFNIYDIFMKYLPFVMLIIVIIVVVVMSTQGGGGTKGL